MKEKNLNRMSFTISSYNASEMKRFFEKILFDENKISEEKKESEQKRKKH